MRSKNVEPRVEFLLQQDNDLRNSDKRLLVRYWATEGLYLTEQQVAVFMECTPAESITRARRALKEQYPASDAVNEQRYERFQEEAADHQTVPKAISWLDD